jgi:hypothetical protein
MDRDSYDLVFVAFQCAAGYMTHNWKYYRGGRKCVSCGLSQRHLYDREGYSEEYEYK